MTPLDLLTVWLERQADPQAVAWLAERRAAVRAEPDARTLTIALGLVPRKIGKAALDLTAEDVSAADRARRGWRPQGLTADQTARIMLLLEAGGADDFPALIKRVLTTSDLAEQIAVYRGLPLYPGQAALAPVAAEGVRSAVRAVFEAVAHGNPFPAEQFTEAAWNQMVLKALFVESTLAPIIGLDDRWNPELARMLRDYAAERTAAGRPVSPELWRGVAQSDGIA
ncbi:EboA domain-containing protein [Sphingomonas quercus]|uniref:EboA domain-containing protein n=1 Tax=Sphingomonas quercus TaxID=2842451 RepID=A0ABS6BP45_9SPHN|nr:EboA domain-containing protein [Sphingomonas quercus]MBU3078985.1 EboA domain-containing protein [Sphingomonas quercus]